MVVHLKSWGSMGMWFWCRFSVVVGGRCWGKERQIDGRGWERVREQRWWRGLLGEGEEDGVMVWRKKITSGRGSVLWPQGKRGTTTLAGEKGAAEREIWVVLADCCVWWARRMGREMVDGFQRENQNRKGGFFVRDRFRFRFRVVFFFFCIFRSKLPPLFVCVED